MAALLAAIILTAVWAWSRSTDDDHALASMAVAVFDGLHGGVAPQATPNEGFGLSRLVGASTASAESGEAAAHDAFALHSALVEKIRADLQAAGVRWADARPIAFGGVRAEVYGSTTQPEAIRAVTGNIYFSAGERVFALEVSAERLNGAYVATDIWQCVSVKTSADNVEGLKAHAHAGYAAFVSEQTGDERHAPRIDGAEPVFIVL